MDRGVTWYLWGATITPPASFHLLISEGYDRQHCIRTRYPQTYTHIVHIIHRLLRILIKTKRAVPPEIILR
ncbi:hypothetical protein SAMN05518855_101132 [Paenibacillus sp. CF384]|nr:hypothetical protein SAMN05518855_101132 [Paenibacillus sp. CF384]